MQGSCMWGVPQLLRAEFDLGFAGLLSHLPANSLTMSGVLVAQCQERTEIGRGHGDSRQRVSKSGWV